MFRKSLIAASLCLVGLVQIAPGAENPSAATAKDWKLRGSGSAVTSGTGYCFFNQTNAQAIKYGKRGSLGGINLVWDKSTTLTNAHFENEGNQGAIKYGEKVAFKIDGIKTPFLRYARRNIGINLTWSETPVFEWMIVGGAEGTPVKLETPFALINTVEKDFLIYAKRGGEAINLRWYLDRNKGGYLDQAKTLVKDEGFKYAAAYLLGK